MGKLKLLRQRAFKFLGAMVATIAIVGSSMFATAPTAMAGNYCGYQVIGRIEVKYIQKGGDTGVLKCPTSHELTNPGNTGKRSEFGPRGIIYWSLAFDAHPVWGLILQRWGSMGYETGPYRYPKVDEFLAGYQADGSVIFQQDFECGRVRAWNGFTHAKYDDFCL